jgi:hypothetical protein
MIHLRHVIVSAAEPGNNLAAVKLSRCACDTDVEREFGNVNVNFGGRCAGNPNIDIRSRFIPGNSGLKGSDSIVTRTSSSTKLCNSFDKHPLLRIE